MLPGQPEIRISNKCFVKNLQMKETNTDLLFKSHADNLDCILTVVTKHYTVGGNRISVLRLLSKFLVT